MPSRYAATVTPEARRSGQSGGPTASVATSAQPTGGINSMKVSAGFDSRHLFEAKEQLVSCSFI